MALKQLLQLSFLVIILSIKNGNAAEPGAFFWKPSLGIDLASPTTVSPPTHFHEASRSNVQQGVVVMIKGYDAGMSLMALVTGAQLSEIAPTLNPFSAYFYTNAYRWGLRHLNMLPQLIGGSKTYIQTTKLWKKRFNFLDTFIPKILRKALPFVKKEEWDKEEKEMVLFKKYAESAFAKGYRYPNKHFNDFKSWETEESQEILEMSSISTEEVQGKK